ncbi:hypothetical protein L3N51_02471 [Metallosphaera sp. J1]|nr:hypothetical protein [Metallosphaera javensis (ex Hofmann et al. 2022)]
MMFHTAAANMKANPGSHFSFLGSPRVMKNSSQRAANGTAMRAVLVCANMSLRIRGHGSSTMWCT